MPPPTITTSDTLLRFSHPKSERYLVRRFTKDGPRQVTDSVTVEEPLEIRITHSFKGIRKTESVAVIMRTPGEDCRLAAGFLLGEGIITRREELLELRQLGDETNSNEVLAELSPSVDVETWRLRRSTVVNSACGLCGKSAVEALIGNAPPFEADSLSVRPGLIYHIPALLEPRQTAFSESGGLHAAASVSPEGNVGQVFEDIGRHNALDKLVGSRLLEGALPFSESFVFMSSRASFELVQKCLAARCPMLITIGAPSSLAIELARRQAMTLVGFIRTDHFNVYSGEWRVTE
jgi:FdhD protein